MLISFSLFDIRLLAIAKLLTTIVKTDIYLCIVYSFICQFYFRQVGPYPKITTRFLKKRKKHHTLVHLHKQLQNWN